MDKSLRSDYGHVLQRMDNLRKIHAAMPATLDKRRLGTELEQLRIAIDIFHRNTSSHVTGKARRVSEQPGPPR